MLARPRLILGSLGLLVLLGCSGGSGHQSSYAYLVNGVAVADLDGNGLPDILGMVSVDVDGAPAQGYVATRLQNAAGAFVLPSRFGVGRGPANLVAADVNGDGRMDLVVANAHEQTVTVRLADAAHPGSFLPAVTLPLSGRTPLDVAVGDLNGDGLLDIAVAAPTVASPTGAPLPAPAVTVFFQTPGTSLAFGPPVSFLVGGNPQAVAIADLDGNGRADLAVATSANTVAVLLQTITGTMGAAVSYPTGVQPVALKAADLDGDGKLDLLTTNWGAATGPDTQGLSVLLQTSGGAFAAPVHCATDFRSAALAVGDLNGDGRLDVVVANAGLPGDPGSVSVFLQSPTTPGALNSPTNYVGVWGPMGVALADLNGDGLPDLVLADGDLVVRFSRSSSPGTFGTPSFFYY